MRSYVILLSYLLFLPGCSTTSFFSPRLNRDILTYPYRTEQQGVAMAVDVLEPERMRTMFRGADVSQNGLQPLLVTIQNNSRRTYFFEQQNFSPRYVPWYTAAKNARKLESGEKVSCGIDQLIYRLPPFVLFTFDSGIPNCESQHGFADEIKEYTIETPDNRGRLLKPSQSLTGILFVRKSELGPSLRLKLADPAQSRTSSALELEVPLTKQSN